MLRVILVAVVSLLTLATLAEAQGRGRPKRPPLTAAGDTPGARQVPTETREISSPAPAFYQFGAWLDDATGSARGVGRVTIGTGFWRARDGTFVDLPIFDGSYALTDRLQLAATVPLYRSRYSGVSHTGLDDVYVSGKITLFDASDTTSGGGLAVTPLLEILGAGYSGDRLHWALPVSVEWRRAPVRFYGSAGYFSRGAVFGGGAVDWATPAGTVLTVALTQSFATPKDGDSRAAQADMSVGLAHALTDAVAAYVSIGRSVAGPPEQVTTFAVTGGVAFTILPRRSEP
jgi:hypothetical protein